MGSMAFQGLLLLEYGVVLKRTEMCVFGGGFFFFFFFLHVLSPDLPCQKEVLWHDGNSPGVDGTQVGIVKQPDKVCLRCFLET